MQLVDTRHLKKVPKSSNLDYVERKIVHWLRMGAEAGRNKCTGAATTREIMGARGGSADFVPASQQLKAMARIRRTD